MSPVLFNPSPELTQVLLERLNSPNYSLTQIAEDHDTTLEALVLWATRPDIEARLRAIKGFTAERARAAAVSQLHVCVEALATTLHAYMKDELNLAPATNSETAHTRDRLRTGARRASWHIQRIARDHPEFVPAELLNVIPSPSAERSGAEAQVRQLPPQPDVSQLTALFGDILTQCGIGFSPSRRVEDPPHRPAPPAIPDPATPPQTAALPHKGDAPPDQNSEIGPIAPIGPIESIGPIGPIAPAFPDPDLLPSDSATQARSLAIPLPPPRPAGEARLGQRPSQERVCAPGPASDDPSDSAAEVLSARSTFDTPVTDPRAQSLAEDAANFRAADPGRAFNEPYVIPDRHIDRLEKAGRRRKPRLGEAVMGASVPRQPHPIAGPAP